MRELKHALGGFKGNFDGLKLQLFVFALLGAFLLGVLFTIVVFYLLSGR